MCGYLFYACFQCVSGHPCTAGHGRHLDGCHKLLSHLQLHEGTPEGGPGLDEVLHPVLQVSAHADKEVHEDRGHD